MANLSKPTKSPVLLIDDSDDIRATLKELLESEGFPVLTAANGREAFKVLASPPRPGIILLDLMMPVMSGPEFMAEQRGNKNLRDIPVIILTAYSFRPEATMIGVADIVIKPIQPTLLIASIRKHALPGRGPARLDA